MHDRFFELGPVDTLVLLGGGKLLLQTVQWAKENKLKVLVITSPRHAEELIDGVSLGDQLSDNQIEFVITKTMSSPEVESFLRLSDQTMYLSFGAAWIFTKEILAKYFQNKLINAHGTRLPENRGGGAFSWQILMDSRLGYCQLHLIDDGLDTGDIIHTKEFLFPTSCAIPADYENYYQDQVMKELAYILDKVRQHEVRFLRKPQISYLSSYWPRLNTEINGWIDWNWSLSDIHRFICAFDDPYSGAKTYLNGSIVAIKRCRIDYSDGRFHPFQTGIIYRTHDDWIYIAKQEGTLIIEKIFDQNGTDIKMKLRVGDRFYTDQATLQKAQSRIIYGAAGRKQ